AVWNAAADDAVHEARAQAERLAKAAGRDLGAARQITFLSRSGDSDSATVTVAVRFALAPAR
ncbi:SIMPL domain-containing protein, partial [Caulobacter sp. 17J65-9]|uniref:SIMPL domain-containing protein n=1 Tax=Caulobacter sp. 17J65-9 TaxID=2709382 RepID=UPI0013C637B5